MALARSKLTSQGQVSVPVEVRRRLGLAAGSTIEWDQAREGAIVVRKAGRYTSAEMHTALFPGGVGGARTLDDLKAGIRHNMRKRRARH